MTEPVGVIGLGNMGLALAKRLAASGPVVGCDLDERRRAAAAAAGIEVTDDARDVAARVGTVLMSLPAPEASRSVLGALLDVMRGGLVIETSTVTPRDVREFWDAAASAGVGLIDAAILSGVEQMEAGTTCLLVGGSEDDLAVAEPVLARICDRRLQFGGPGTGMAAKVINNAVAHAVMVVLAEAAALAAGDGIELAALCHLLEQDDAGVKRPLSARLGGRALSRDFEGGMSTEAARKDSALALEMARASGTPLFAIQASDTVYELALRHGLARSDYAAIVKLWDR